MDIDLGLIRAIHKGATAPTNTSMVWYNTGDNVLYYFDAMRADWLPLAVQPYKYTAGAGISRNRVVLFDESTAKVVLADKDLHREQGDKVVGVALNDAAVNDIVLVSDFSFIEDSSWTFDTAKKVFLGNNGELTQVKPNEGVLIEIAEAYLPTRLRINLKRPVKLLGVAGGGGVTPAGGSSSIPAPEVFIEHPAVIDGSGRKVLLRWNGEYPEMFDKDIEIWSFVQGGHRVGSRGVGRATRKSWSHQPHMNSDNSGSKWYGGTVLRPNGFGLIRTEFPIPAAMQDKRPVEFGFDPTDYFRVDPNLYPSQRLPDVLSFFAVDGFTDASVRAFGSRTKCVSIRFAFVVREESGDYPFTVGAMSDIIRMHWGKGSGHSWSIVLNTKSSG